MSAEQVDRLRDLLQVPDKASQRELDRRLGAVEMDIDELPQRLPGALRQADAQGQSLAVALEGPLAKAVEGLARNRRSLLANALFPVLGPAIRQAITEALRGLVDNLNQLLESTFTLRGLRWRIQAWRSGMPYAQVALRHLLLYSVDHLFLIQNGSGLLLARAHQHQPQSNDSDAVAAMLTAIRDFMRDSGLAPGEAELRQVELGAHLLRLYPGPEGYLAAAISGVPGQQLDESLSVLLETMHETHSSQLAQGDPDPGLDQQLQDWFTHSGRSQLVADRPSEGRMAKWLLAGLASLLLVLAGERVWTGYEARRLSAQIGTEPGYLAQVQRSGWRQLRVSGMRDPQAVPVAEVVGRSGLQIERVEQRLGSFLALEPALMLARMKSMLKAPPGVVLEMRDGVLRISGSADRQWSAMAQQRLDAWSGLQAYDWQLSVPPPAPPVIDPLPEAVDLKFNEGVDLSAEGRAALSGIAAWFDAQARPSPQLRLRLIAETDGVGSSEWNSRLAPARLAAVRQALIDLGVPEHRFLPGEVQPEAVPGRDMKHRRVRAEPVELR